MSPSAVRDLSTCDLAQLIRPSGYYHAKALKLKALVRWLSDSCGDNLDQVFVMETGLLRQQLLAVYGIGPETADSILLYAANKPVFVIDSYTRRICARLGLIPKEDSYNVSQVVFENNLPQNVVLFNEYHALLVRLGKDVCRKQPVCDRCCLRKICRFQRLSQITH